MAKSVRVHVDEIVQGPDRVRRTARAEHFRGRRQTGTTEFFFDLTGPDVARPLPATDWAVLAVLFGAMRRRQDIHIDAPVSKSLLDNLEEFQAAFSMWLPQLNKVDIVAQSETSSAPAAPADDAVVAFSGGVDASFTAYRHLFRKAGKRHKNLKTAVLVHGFDIPPDNEEAFRRAADTAQTILDGTGLSIASVRTNLKPLLGFSWEQAFVAALGACLHQFSANHGTALIASGESYVDAVYPWGSNPATNHLLGSDFMRFVTDGSGFSRTQKVGFIADWPAARDNVRVCWEGPITGRNCGRCEKCIRTILNFRAVGAPLTRAFPVDVSDDQIRDLKLRRPIHLALFVEIYEAARSRGLAGSWLTELKHVIDRGVQA